MKNIIPKEEIVEAINKIKRINKAVDDLNSFFNDNNDVFVDSNVWLDTGIEIAISSLSWAVGVDPNKDDILWWWCFESDFGNTNLFKINPPDGLDPLDIWTAEELYDYCLQLTNKDNE